MRARVLTAGVCAATLAVAVAGPVTGGTAAPRHHETTDPTGVLLVPRPFYRAGQSVTVTVVNRLQTPILHLLCFALQRRSGEQWVAARPAATCPAKIGAPQAARSREPVNLVLFPSLAPARYRILLRYRAVHGATILKMSGPVVRSVAATITVLRAKPQRHTKLSAQRLLAIAEHAATADGDPHPTLIQHAAGTHYDAVKIASGDTVYDWTWSYLIAIRGHFTATGVPIPRGAATPIGTVITLVIDARTGQTTDFGLGDRYPNLARLGPVTTDLRTG